MARTYDAAFPTVTLEDHPRQPAWWTGHGQLVIALERLPQAAYVWDDDDPDVTWDDVTPERVWDAPFIGSGFTDVYCDMVTLELTNGEPDQYEAFRTPYCRLTLRDPGDGRYRARTADGRLIYWAPGRRLGVWWHDEAGVNWWLFSGRIATWKDPFLTADVTVEAYASMGNLASPLGREWTAGAAGQLPSQRATNIVAVAPAYTDRTSFELGDVTLTVPPASDTAKLDELRRVARSDGGIVYGDADDTVVMRDRRWRGGRADQTTVPVVGTNVCEAIVVWDAVAADVDQRLAGRVTTTNLAGLTATATNPDVDPSIVWAHPDADLWTTSDEGTALAVWMAKNRADARLAIGQADIHLHDIRFDYWHAMLNLRIGDRIRLLHEDRYGGTGDELYDVTLVVTTLRHAVTRDSFTVQFGTTPAVAYTPIELWDVTQLTWDDTNPLAVWR